MLSVEKKKSSGNLSPNKTAANNEEIECGNSNEDCEDLNSCSSLTSCFIDDCKS